MSNKGVKTTKPKMQSTEATKSPEKPVLRKIVVAAILGAATLVGVPAAVVTFFPRLTATFSDPSDPDNPFSSSVTITNVGAIPLESVGSGIAIREIHVMGPNGITGYEGSQDYKTVITTGEGHSLGLDQSFSFALNNLSVLQELHSYPMVSADLAVVVEYEVPIVHIHRTKTFIKFAQKQTNGNFYWYAKSQPN